MRRYSALVCALVLVLTAFIPAARVSAAPTPTGDFAEVPCAEFEVADPNVLCGYTTVPLRHADPGGATIKLATVFLPARGTSVFAEPLVMLQGGPGGSTIETYNIVLSLPLAASVRDGYDVILFDQRGTKFSQPFLGCPESAALTDRTIEQDLPREEALRLGREALLACRARLIADGVDLGAFNSFENADDVPAIAAALGFDQINLYGVSYGTQLGQHVMQRHPDLLRSVILDAVVTLPNSFNLYVPQSQTRVFNEVFSTCAADPACNAAYPNLKDRFTALIAKLDANPARMRITNGEANRTYDAVLNGEGLTGLLFQAMYDRTLVRGVPRLIERVEQSQFGEIGAIASAFLFNDSVAIGMYYTVTCAEEADNTPDQVPLEGVDPIFAENARTDFAETLVICDAFDLAPLGPSADEPVRNDLPTLLLNGQFDPITPPQFGAEVAAGLPNATNVTFADTAHGALFSSECATAITIAFLADPAQTPDTNCAESGPPALFSPANTMFLHSGGWLLDALNARGLERLVPIVLPLLVLGTPFVIWPLLWLYRIIAGRRRPQPAPTTLARLAIVGVAVLATIFLVGYVGWIFTTVLQNDLTLTVGAPRSLLPLFLLPPLVALLAVGSGVFAGVAWARGWWTTAGRVYYSLLALAALVLAGGMAWWGWVTAVV